MHDTKNGEDARPLALHHFSTTSEESYTDVSPTSPGMHHVHE